MRTSSLCRVLPTLVVATTLLAVAPVGRASAASTPRAPHSKVQSGARPASLLFVVQGRSARAERHGKAWTVSVKVPNEKVVWFTDRPLRRSSHMPVRKFVRSWKSYGFDQDPPNAALAGTRGTKDHDIPVELRKPAWNASRKELSFSVTPLQKGTQIPRTLDDVSLFVDDAQDTIQLNLTNLTQVGLQIQSAAPDISTWTSAQSPTIGWDFGEGSANGPSLNIGYTNPNPGVAFVAQFILVGDYQNQWQLMVTWDGNGSPSATITQFSGQGIGLMNQQNQLGVPVQLPNLNPDYGQTANYQVVFSQAQQAMYGG
jgi:hypothetical protein